MQLFHANRNLLFVLVNMAYGALLIVLRPYDWHSTKQYCLFLDLSMTAALTLLGWVQLGNDSSASNAIGPLMFLSLLLFAFWFLLREFVAKQLVNRRITVESKKEQTINQFKRMTKLNPKKIEELQKHRNKDDLRRLDKLVGSWTNIAARSNAAAHLEYFLQSRYLNLDMIKVEIDILVLMRTDDRRGHHIAKRYVTYEHIYSTKLEESR